jgi:hypothetical protein
MPDRELLVRIVGDDRDLQRALGNTNRSLQQIDQRTATFGRNVGRAFAAAGIAVGASEITRLAGNAVAAATDLNEQIDRTRVILGDSAEEMIEWSKTTADAMGIAQRQALASAAGFAGLFQTVGVSQDLAAQFSRTLVTLAADLASLQNTSPEEALLALRSGLVGEAEPLRRFNIFLTEAAVQQEALAASGKKAASELTAEEKALARLNIIIRQGGPAMGNFVLTQDSAANSARVLRANLDELAADIGNVLLPALTGLTRGATEGFNALEKLGSVDVSPGGSDFTVSDLAGWVGGWKTFNFLLDQIVPKAEDLHAALLGISTIQPGIGGAQRAEARRRRAAQGIIDENAPLRELKAARKRFDEFQKGLGLKLDRAQLTRSTDDDLAVLRELERAILRRIAAEGRTFKLVSLLTDTRLQINAVVEQQAQDAKQASEDAFNATIDALSLDVDVARSTKTLADDLPKLRALEQAILRRIADEGETTDLLRQLFNVRQEQEQVAQQLRNQQRERRRGRQFEALGLTAEGDERTPGIGALRRRGRGLIEELEASGLDEKKVTAFVKRVSAIFTDQFNNAGREVRQAIQQLFETINQALDQGSKGPLTKTSGLNTKKILAGLGLSPEEVNALRGRLSGFNTAGRGLAVPPSLQPGVPVGVGAGAAGGIVVESHTTINLDGQKVANVVTRNQQKTRRRNPKQKRGPNRNR